MSVCFLQICTMLPFLITALTTVTVATAQQSANPFFFPQMADFTTMHKNMFDFMRGIGGGTNLRSPFSNTPMTHQPQGSMLAPGNHPMVNQLMQMLPITANHNRPQNVPHAQGPLLKPTSGIQAPKIGSGPDWNTAYWQDWFSNRETQANAIFSQGIGSHNHSAGYENDQFCVYDLRMHYLYGSPDGVQKRMIGFNGQFPGPTLRCTSGKTMIVRVTNDIMDNDEPTSIHWHGIQQTLTPFYDGPQSVTQCPVIRSTSMIYKFQVFQAGTYWYHSHHSYQYVDGAWGFLIVKNDPEECWQNSYDDERLISITDWIHRAARNVSETYLTRGNFPATNSSLINGRGTFNCSNIEPGQICNPRIQGPAVVDVVQGKRYRLRVLNSSGARTYNFSIDGHKLVVIETDGVDTFKSPKVDIVEIWPGHRYSLIVIMDQPLGEYWIRITGDPGSAAFAITDGLRGRAVLRYSPSSDGVMRLGLLAEPTQPGGGSHQGRPHFQNIPWNDIISSGGIQVPSREDLQKYFPHSPPKVDWQLQTQLDAAHARLVSQTRLPTSSTFHPATAVLLNQNQAPPLEIGNVDGNAPPYYDRLVVMNATDCPIAGSPVRMCMNGAPYVPQSINSRPILYQVVRGIPVPSSARPIYTPTHKEVVRIVINNRHRFPHPWHLHGHSFWVLGTGADQAGDFVPSRDNAKLTTQGVRRDTTHTLGNSWAVITYATDNPGVWFFHCHINWHLEAGLGMTFIEGRSITRQVYKFPPLSSTQTCARVGVSLT